MSCRKPVSHPQAAWFAACLLLLVALVAGGCKTEQGNSLSPDAAAELPLRVLVVDDEPLANAVKLAWDSRVGGSTKVTTTTAAELLATQRKRLNADVILYPSYLLGELAEGDLIEPLDSEDTADPVFDRQGLFELIRLREITWGSKVYAVPLGSPQFTLLYRKDIFDKLQLKPPTTWEEYQILAKQLSDRSAVGDLASPGNEAWIGAVEPLAQDWAGPMFLARAATYARHRNQYSTLFDFNSMEALIASPPFERAMEELAAIAADNSDARHTPESARRMFLSGNCAMAITWPSRGGDVSPESTTDRDDWIGVAELPGSPAVYNVSTQSWEQRAADENLRVPLIAIDGRLGSVTTDCRRKKQALGMLFMISGDELGTAIGSASSHTTLFRESQLGKASDWVDRECEGAPARQYGEVILATQNSAAWLDAIRIPGRSEYIAALERAVNSVVAAEATPPEALKEAAAEWNKITDSIGRESQQRAYMRSLGLDP
ncbi:MAG: extracellular solute-binding protein [Planctomycetota bacterium]|nr:extracellular solute-binding protein [Planctomycetota bacterium]